MKEWMNKILKTVFFFLSFRRWYQGGSAKLNAFYQPCSQQVLAGFEPTTIQLIGATAGDLDTSHFRPRRSGLLMKICFQIGSEETDSCCYTVILSIKISLHSLQFKWIVCSFSASLTCAWTGGSHDAHYCIYARRWL